MALARFRFEESAYCLPATRAQYVHSVNGRESLGRIPAAHREAMAACRGAIDKFAFVRLFWHGKP